jgi:hypothetical protein
MPRLAKSSPGCSHATEMTIGNLPDPIAHMSAKIFSTHPVISAYENIRYTDVSKYSMLLGCGSIRANLTA